MENRVIVLVLGTATFLAAGFADGQQMRPGALEVAAGLRSQAEQGRMHHHVPSALVQLWRPHPPEELEALADSLMEVGIDLATRQGPHGYTIGTLAANALISAATWSPGPGKRGTPYPAAAERVAEMAYRLPGGDPGILNQVRPIIGDEQWLAHMRRLATSDLTPGAGIAVVTLEGEGPVGLEVLRELYDEDLAHEPRAQWRLRELAKSLGWG